MPMLYAYVVLYVYVVFFLSTITVNKVDQFSVDM